MISGEEDNMQVQIMSTSKQSVVICRPCQWGGRTCRWVPPCRLSPGICLMSPPCPRWAGSWCGLHCRCWGRTTGCCSLSPWTFLRLDCRNANVCMNVCLCEYAETCKPTVGWVPCFKVAEEQLSPPSSGPASNEGSARHNCRVKNQKSQHDTPEGWL